MSEKQSEKMYKTLKKQNKKLLFYLSIPTLGIILDLYFQFQIFTDKAPAIIVLSITLAVFIYIYFLASRIVILNNYIKALENNELKEYYEWLEKNIQRVNYKKVNEKPVKNR